jgi:hypothetical protein
MTKQRKRERWQEKDEKDRKTQKMKSRAYSECDKRCIVYTMDISQRVQDGNKW